MRDKRFLIFGTSLGSALEYFDFVIFMMFSAYIGETFFPHSTTFVARLETLSLFAVGYFARPLGGMLFGHFGDRIGRKSCFTVSIMLMALTTFAIAFLPGYNKIGEAGAIILCVLRVLQGVAQGAELPGALTFISEHSPNEVRGLRCGIITMSVGLGATFASLISFILVSIFSHEHMLAFGWRLPFILGGLIGLVGYQIRKNTKETPQFLEQEQLVKIPMMELIKNYPGEIAQGIMFTFFAAWFIIFALYFPVYIKEYFHYSTKQIILAYTFSTLWSSLLVPLSGRLSDYVGRRRQMYLATTAASLSLYFLFKLLSFGTTLSLYGFMFGYQTIIAAIAGCYPASLAEMFPTKVRYSGVAFCYNVSFSLGSLAPIFSAAVLHKIHWPFVVAIMFTVLSVITAYSLRDRSVAFSN